MGDTTITIIAIILASVLMFVFPLMAISDRTDDIRLTGKLTKEKYEAFVQILSSTGNAYDVEMEIQVLDENPGKKATVAEKTKIGENVYYSKYTTQIWQELDVNGGTISLKEGDRVLVSVKNTSSTISQQLKNFFYKVAGSDTYQVSASSTGIVAVNGV